MKKTLVIISLTLTVLIAILLTSCGAKSPSYEDMPPANKGDYSTETDKELAGGMENGSPDYTKIIKTVTAYGETKNYDECVDGVKALAGKYNGYVESSNVSGNSYNSIGNTRSASFVFRIPSESLEIFKDDVDALMNITSLSEASKNVSQEYYDIEAIIETLSAERDGLLNILKSLDNSKQYDYWLTVTERLSDIEKQIAVYKAQLNNLDNKISYSTYSLTIDEVKEYTEDAPENFGERVSVAFKESWAEFSDKCQSFAVGFIYFIPTLLTLAIIGGSVAGIIIFANKKSGKKNK